MDITKTSEYLRGKQAEVEFSKFFDTFKTSTTKQDIHEHWDVEIDNGTKIKVDVKSIKKENRQDIFYNENFHWVEIKNVTGKIGWLYGLADAFAFEVEDYWIIVDKIKLQNFIAAKCKGQKIGTVKAIYKLYRRSNSNPPRKDVVVKVKTLDLMYLSDLIIPKKEIE